MNRGKPNGCLSELDRFKQVELGETVRGNPPAENKFEEPEEIASQQ